MTAEPLALVALGMTILNAAVGLVAFHRAGRWKDTESAAALMGRVSDVENRCTSLEAREAAGATKADVAELGADLRSLARELGTVERGVERIEQFLMGRDK